MVSGFTPPHFWYVPPEYPLVEPAEPAVAAGTPVTRSLVGFNGLVGEVAESVRLGWRCGQRRAVVTVGGDSADQSSRRLGAAHLALSGSPWSPTFTDGPSSNAATWAALDLLASQPGLWRETALDLDGTSVRVEVVAATPAVMVGVVLDAQPNVVFAATGLDPSELNLRRLAPEAAGGYDLSPFEPAAARDLQAAGARFWDGSDPARSE